MGKRGRELVAADESTVVAKLLFDAIVVKDGKSDGCLANPAGTDQSDRCEALCPANDLLGQLAASEEYPRWWGWGFPIHARWKYETSELLVIKIADLSWVYMIIGVHSVILERTYHSSPYFCCPYPPWVFVML